MIGEFLSGWRFGDSTFAIVAAYILTVVAAYLLGSLNFAVIFSKRLYGNDIRSTGSGNAGSTNMLRTFGKKAAALTFVCDALKAVVSVLIGYILIAGEGGAWLAAFFCLIGHIFPVFYRFRGGKGVAAAAGALIILNPIVLLILLLLFAIVVLWTKYVSLGSVITAFLMPILNSKLNVMFVSDLFELGFSILIAVIIIIMHIPNLKRLRDGTESKIRLGSGKNDLK